MIYGPAAHTVPCPALPAQSGLAGSPPNHTRLVCAPNRRHRPPHSLTYSDGDKGGGSQESGELWRFTHSAIFVPPRLAIVSRYGLASIFPSPSILSLERTSLRFDASHDPIHPSLFVETEGWNDESKMDERTAARVEWRAAIVQFELSSRAPWRESRTTGARIRGSYVFRRGHAWVWSH